MKTTTRRAILAGAAALPLLPAAGEGHNAKPYGLWLPDYPAGRLKHRPRE